MIGWPRGWSSTPSTATSPPSGRPRGSCGGRGEEWKRRWWRSRTASTPAVGRFTWPRRPGGSRCAGFSSGISASTSTPLGTMVQRLYYMQYLVVDRHQL